MTIETFIEHIEVEFEELEKGTIQPETNFRDIEDWGSMHALIIIAIIDTEYDITLSGSDLRSVSTVQELFDLVKSKK